MPQRRLFPLRLGGMELGQWPGYLCRTWVEFLHVRDTAARVAPVGAALGNVYRTRTIRVVESMQTFQDTNIEARACSLEPRPR